MPLTKASAGVLNIDDLYGFRNRIINGDMRIDQRNAGASVTPANAGYTLDRWFFSLSQASKLTAQQDAGAVTLPAGFNDYLGVTSSSAYTVGATELFLLRQAIEGFNTADLGWGTANAKTVTLSFWVRSSLTGTFGGSIFNSAADRFYPFSYTISSVNTWEQKSITIAGDTTGTWLVTNGIGVNVSFSLGTGSTRSGTAGSWGGTTFWSSTGATSVVGTNGATFYITGVQFEVGSVATPFERRPYGMELALCQRYYQVIARGVVYFADATAQTSSNAFGVIRLPVTMRTTPTGSVVSGSNYYRFLAHDADDLCNSVNITGQSPDIVIVGNNSEISQTQGRAGLFTTLDAASFVACQAEL
jgi:hypothetical protein